MELTGEVIAVIGAIGGAGAGLGVIATKLIEWYNARGKLSFDSNAQLNEFYRKALEDQRAINTKDRNEHHHDLAIAEDRFAKYQQEITLRIKDVFDLQVRLLSLQKENEDLRAVAVSKQNK